MIALALRCGEAISGEPQKLATTEKDNIPLSSTLGCQYLKETRIDKFVELSIHFVTQDNTAFCGVASSVMVLNAAGIERPPIAPRAASRLWTQENFWTDAASKVAGKDVVGREGMTLDTLGQLLAAHQMKVEVRHSASLSLDEFRSSVSKAVDEPGSFVLINYFRPTVGQEGAGHISPVAAYNPAADMFLILDVARYRYEPLWISTRVLYDASATIDASVAASRGFVVCRKPSSPNTATAPAR